MGINYSATATLNVKQSLFDSKIDFKNKVIPSFINPLIPKINDQLIGKKIEKFTFKTFYHPYFELLLETLNRYGLPAIFNEGLLDKSDKNVNGDGRVFKDRYDPNSLLVKGPYPVEEFTFDIDKPYAQDNWMTFYHIIILIVETLLLNNKNDEAIFWIEQCLYNPKAVETTADPKHPGKNAKFWKLPVFKDELTESTTDYFNKISDNDFQNLINDLEANPFNPFLVAYHRPQEFMMHVVQLYVKAHISQGDVNFRMAYNGGGMDYLNLALEYYKVCKIQLGERLQTIPNILKKKPESFQSLKDKGFKADVNALVQFENIFPYCSQNTLTEGNNSNGSILGGGYTFYFSVPPDNAINELHDLIDDRLFKLRNCRDIDGIIRKIDLFGTPIDPDQLLAALSKGLSFGEILGSMFAPPPLYKFSFNLQKAKETCNELKTIGTTISGAIEKGDAEELALLLATHEMNGLTRMIPIKERQIYQSQLEKQSLLKLRDTAVFTVNYYQSLLGLTGVIKPYVDLPAKIDSSSPCPPDIDLKPSIVDVDVSLVDSGERGVSVIPKEMQEIQSMNDASDRRSTAGDLEEIASFMHAIPGITIDIKPIGIGPGNYFSGSNIAAIFSGIAKSYQNIADGYTHDSSLAAKLSSLIRRDQEWTFQLDKTQLDILKIDKDLAISDVKIQSAQIDRDNLDKQITEIQNKQDFLLNKESNHLVYPQIVDRLKVVHKNFYDLATHYVRSTEQAYQFEKPEKVIDFFSYNYDNSIIGCATVADELNNTIHQMEKAYLSDTLRPLEMKLNIQLSRLDPIALINLRKIGKAVIAIPEWFLLLKNRSVYNAKWISVNFTFPMITGPFINMNARIEMTKNFVRTTTNMKGKTFEQQAEDDRFVQRTIPYNRVLITNGNNDLGYNLDPSSTGNELYQQQYRPFEQAGAICEFDIDLNSNSDKFNFTELNWDILSDVIISGAISVDIDEGAYKENAENYLSSLYKNIDNKALSLFIDIKHDLPNELYKFTSDVNLQSLVFNIDQSKFPYIAQGKKITLTTFQVITKDDLSEQTVPFNLQNFKWKKSDSVGEYQIFILEKNDDSTSNINVVLNNIIEINLKLTKENVANSYLVMGYMLGNNI